MFANRNRSRRISLIHSSLTSEKKLNCIHIHSHFVYMLEVAFFCTASPMNERSRQSLPKPPPTKGSPTRTIPLVQIYYPNWNDRQKEEYVCVRALPATYCILTTLHADALCPPWCPWLHRWLDELGKAGVVCAVSIHTSRPCILWICSNECTRMD